MQVSHGALGTPPKSSALRAAAASFAGAVMDWYDFFVYGLVAALTFPKLFFPSNNPATGTLLTFATFGVGFVARPLGGIMFGNFLTGLLYGGPQPFKAPDYLENEA